ncbi:MAG: sugar transferase [Calditrichaceae bacterium]
MKRKLEETSTEQKSYAAHLPYPDKRNNWHDSSEFSTIMKREIARSYRSGLPLSYLIFDMSEYTELKINVFNTKKLKYDRFLKLLIELINQNTREVDIKCVKSNAQIDILLVDTDKEGANIYLNKMKQTLNAQLNIPRMKNFREIIKSVKLSCYTLNQLTGKGEISIKSSLKTILGSLVGIFLFGPIMIVIAIMVKYSSPGPILFKQKRVGYLGKEFTFLKFRSMRTDVDDQIHQDYVKKLIEGKNDEINMGTEDKPIYKIVDDPRVTTVGAFIRKTSLDELPQFFNVLKGEMSLVGPRPPIPYEIDSYKNWHLERIAEVKPGITGMWQAYGRSETTFDDMVRYDIQYVDNQSIWVDIKILFVTILTVFKSKGAM